MADAWILLFGESLGVFLGDIVEEGRVAVDLFLANLRVVSLHGILGWGQLHNFLTLLLQFLLVVIFLLFAFKQGILSLDELLFNLFDLFGLLLIFEFVGQEDFWADVPEQTHILLEELPNDHFEPLYFVENRFQLQGQLKVRSEDAGE